MAKFSVPGAETSPIFASLKADISKCDFREGMPVFPDPFEVERQRSDVSPKELKVFGAGFVTCTHPALRQLLQVAWMECGRRLHGRDDHCPGELGATGSHPKGRDPEPQEGGRLLVALGHGHHEAKKAAAARIAVGRRPKDAEQKRPKGTEHGKPKSTSVSSSAPASELPPQPMPEGPILPSVATQWEVEHPRRNKIGIITQSPYPASGLLRPAVCSTRLCYNTRVLR